jgi:hypothetical protein
MDTDLLSDTFVELADTMVADFDVIDFLHLLTDRAVALLGAAAAGVLLADPRGELRVAAASSCWSCSSCRTTRGRAWSASAPAGPSPRPAWPGRPSGGPGSPTPPWRPGS